MSNVTVGVKHSLRCREGLGRADDEMGQVIPGLIANDMFKQGILKTVLGVSVLAIVVKLLLLLVI